MHRLALASLLALLPGCPASTSLDGGLDAPSATFEIGTADTAGRDTPPGDVPIPDVPASDVPSDLDAGWPCAGTMGGFCADGALGCHCCPAGGPTMNCVCSTPCTTDADCTDAARPTCQHPPDGPGFCAPAAFTCCWLCL